MADGNILDVLTVEEFLQLLGRHGTVLLSGKDKTSLKKNRGFASPIMPTRFGKGKSKPWT
jgi:hypothetical protein